MIRPRASNPGCMTRKEATLYLQQKGCPIGLKTLSYYASGRSPTRQGPPFVKLGKNVGYKKVDLDAWAETHTEFKS